MTDLDKAIATQLANIVKRTGKSIPELTASVKGSGLSKHGELVAMLKSTLGMGHGDANTLVHTVLKSDGQGAAAAKGRSAEQVLDGLYTGPKEVLPRTKVRRFQYSHRERPDVEPDHDYSRRRLR